MGEIKSSWEIALEKTKNIEADKSILEAEKYKKAGKKIISEFIDDQEATLDACFTNFKSNQVKWVKEGMFEALISHIVLPQDVMAQNRLKHLNKAFSKIMDSKPKIKMIFEQLAGFYKEYIEQKSNIREAVEQQYAPKLEQKRRALSQKMGRDIPLDPESDPEFLQFLRQNITQFDQRYQEVLNQAKAELKKMFKENQ